MQTVAKSYVKFDNGKLGLSLISSEGLVSHLTRVNKIVATERKATNTLKIMKMT